MPSRGNKLRSRWRAHRYNARLRGVEFLLTFEQWLAIWVASGQLDKRGCRRGQYVMARCNDVGPYAEGNVQIVPSERNNSEWVRTEAMRAKMRARFLGSNSPKYGKPLSETTRAKMRETIRLRGHPKGYLGKKHTEAYKKMMRERMSGKNNPMYGRPPTAEHSRRLSEGQRRRWTRSRNVKDD